MLSRLVRPMLREHSSRWYFRQRIPNDVRARAVGLKLAIPCGDRTVLREITSTTTHIKFSLGTRDPNEVKARQAEAAAYLEVRPTRSTRQQVRAGLVRRSPMQRVKSLAKFA